MQSMFFSAGIILLLVSASCQKQTLPEDQLARKASEYQSKVLNNRYRLEAFYSDKPIDYITTDAVVKSETDLWPYVQLHLYDDENLFGPAQQLMIYQNAQKITTIDSAVVLRTFTFTADAQNVYFNFVDYQYLPMKYKVSSFESGSLLAYIDWPGGARVYSRFRQLP